MAEKQIKIKDMIIAVICTLLAVLAIVFYFLPAFSVEHSGSFNFEVSEKFNYSAWDMTQAVFTNVKDLGSDMYRLIYIKELYGMPLMLSGLLMPIGLLFTVATAVFAYLSWFKGEKFKKFCFLCGLCSMVFTTITLISTWYLAIQLQNDTTGALIEVFYANIKGSISYGSFVSLIIAFVVAIVACAYYYFLDNFDEDEDEEDEEDDDEDEEEEEEEAPKKVKTAKSTVATKSVEKTSTPTAKSATAKKTSTK